ncbi:hypothetical protein GGI20_001446 [Coemansia sp. BCRC 34301]|nr:hypothetical protein GGI20_001446 [Coemansia sp. BCRC 34301]
MVAHPVPPPISRAPIISRTYQHTGDEPVEPGVYNPIRSRALLPHERQRRREGNNPPAAQGGTSLPTATAGRLLNDGTISVDDVDDSGYAEALSAASRQNVRRMYPGGAYYHGGSNDEQEDDDDDEEGEETGYSTTEEGPSVSRQWRRDMGSSGPLGARRGRSQLEFANPALALFGGGGGGRHLRYVAAQEANLLLPLHAGILSHHMQHIRRTQRRQDQNGNINHLDFFPGEDLGDLLSFLEANAPPPPPSRPMSPTRPIKLTKLQEELAANPDYSRRVPDANYRDSAEAPTGKSLEIVCTQCTGSLYDKEHIWATPCGHVICNDCVVEAFAGASKLCGACKKRVMKKSLVHLFT